MADPRFFRRAGPFSIQQLATLSSAETSPGADPDALYVDVRALDQAAPEHVSFIDNRKYLADFRASKAGVCVAHPDVADGAPAGMTLLTSKQPYAAFGRIAQAFYPGPSAMPTGLHIDPAAVIGGGCALAPGAVVGAGAEIGKNCSIGANTVIGPGVVIGDGCVIEAGVVLSHCLIGQGCLIHAGAAIGQDGFGFAMGADGPVKVPQLGRVIIGDGVEIGANTTIDRGAGPDTEIGDGCQIDNLVQIGHNVKLGRNCVVVAQVGISGSTTIGDFVMIGGQAGLTGHLTIGDGARIAAQAGVMRDVAPGQTVGGAPAVAMRDWLKQVATLERLTKAKKGQKGERG